MDREEDSNSTPGLVETLLAEGLCEAQIIKRIGVAVQAGDKEAVFALAEELTRENGDRG